MDENRARALLRAERAELTTVLRETEEEAGPRRTDGPGDYGDAALPLTEQGGEEAVTGELKDRIATIDRALARIEAGTYGRSVLSGKPIPAQRLAADPAAELTIDEARAAEHEQ